MKSIQIAEPDIPISANIVKYENQFNQQKIFNQLTGKEQDLFFAIILLLINQNKNKNDQILEVLIYPKQVKKIAGLNNRSKHYNKNTIRVMLSRLSTVANGLTFILTEPKKDTNNQVIKDKNGNPILFSGTKSIFEDFAYSGDTQTNNNDTKTNNNNADNDNDEDDTYVLVKVREEAAHYFFNITKGFTQFFYENYTKISSKYAKAIYRELLNGSNALKGEWDVDIEELADWLNITKKDTFKRFRKNLGKYVAEIEKTNDFKNKITVEYIYATKKKKKTLARIKFKYQLNPQRMQKIENTIYSPEYNQNKLIPLNLRTIEDKQVIKIPYLCPECHGQVYSFKTKFGDKLTMCQNSEKYNLGTHTCRYQNFKEDLKNKNLWIDNTDIEEDLSQNSKSSKKYISTPFIPPTVEEVQQYIESYKLQKNYDININAENFVDHYEAIGWKKKNGMEITSWEPLVRIWVRNAVQYNKQNPEKAPQNTNPTPMTTEEENEKARKEAEELGITYSN